MKVTEMRVHIKARYGNNPAWVQRVDRMEDDQVIAIYMRMLRDNDLTHIPKKPASKAPMSKPSDAATLYVCNGCGRQYLRDNPELEECEFCGYTSLLRASTANAVQQLSFTFGGVK